MEHLKLFHRDVLTVRSHQWTTNDAKARTIERAAPAVADRLRAAGELSAAGIPVHFHVSPVIPGFYEAGEMDATVQALAAHGGECVYSNILGMRQLNTGVWFDSVARLPARVAERTRDAYIRSGDADQNVYSPDVELIHQEMTHLQAACRRHGLDFICEFIPGLDVFDPARFERGIFRFGLPTVYQMAALFDGPPVRKGWPQFRDTLERRFPAVDDEYLGFVETLWEDGQLFENARMDSELVDGRRNYFRTDHLRLATDSVLSWD